VGSMSSSSACFSKAFPFSSSSSSSEGDNSSSSDIEGRVHTLVLGLLVVSCK
jgi:hypothetical protein